MARLTRYQQKRDFTRTPEPSGEGSVEPPDGQRFVVQRHRARRLHYDFRLEMDGVLVSWAVPKGLTLDPKARHLAVHVEDHPLDYIDFEGVIPKDEYGAGDVIVWDRGTYKLDVHDDPLEALDGGELHLDLYGQKLRGRFVLVRTDRRQGDKEQWLILHKKDQHAVTEWDPEDHPRSVITGRTNDEVKADPDRLWTRAGEQVLCDAPLEFEPPTGDELAALDALPKKGKWVFQGRELMLTNLDKVLFPGREGDPPVTKRELIRYYASIAPVMLPHLVGRPLNLHRYPDGVERKGFWQKEAPDYTPEWFTTWRNEEADPGESEVYLIADSPPALAWLGNHGAVELHPWTSRLADVHCPTYALIDIDPGEDTTWDDLLTLARLHRTALEHMRVHGYPKVSGKRGIQVWVPIAVGPSFEETRAWVEQLSRAIGAVVPDLVSWEWEKRSRGGKARLDFTQNAINKTLVAPYSVRAAPGATVSMPISWDELDEGNLRSDTWTIRSAPSRVAEVGDLMAPMLQEAQTLPPFT